MLELVRWAVFAGVIGIVTAHVRLSFPPARTYAFDFLDNLRTEGPCGMPSSPGGPVTTLSPGETINVTWHLAYAHRGGYKLFIIPRNGTEVLANLTSPEGWIGGNDTTAIMHEVKIPSDMMVGDYSLVLNRLAAEWGTGIPDTPYTFHSCADITITAGAVCNMNCSGNGVCVSNKCECNDLASGEYCQYLDDCMNEADCSMNGVCTVVSDISYSFPRAVCFCNDGFHGRYCNKENPSDFKVDMTAAEMESYFHRELSESMEVYYKVLTSSNEVEVVVKSTGKSWLGFGWRPQGMNGTCRDFPVAYWSGESPEGEPETEPEPTAPPASMGSRRRRSVRSLRVIRDSHDMDDMCVPGGQDGGAEPEPGASPEPGAEPEPGATPEPGAVPEPGASPEPEVTPEPEGEPEGPGVGPLHAMDCVDIVIGMVDGERSRVGDYYTRDRSTPRYDSFYGGTEDLTAAGGKEYTDYTIIKFRKKLTSTEMSDHSISSGPMHIIFARGQEAGHYVHNPPSGIELCTGDQRFYKRFELKYHGTHPDQRGQVPNFDFFVDPNAQPPTGPCTGSYLQPMNCEGDACDYRITWTYDAASDKIQFNIDAKTEMNKWTGVGFSKQGQMIGSDAIIAYTKANGEVVVEDRYLGGKSAPAVVVDTTNNLEEVSASYSNGIMTIAFSRARDTKDMQDLAFTDNDCLHMLIPTNGGSFDEAANTLGYHGGTPTVTNKICIKACSVTPGPTGPTDGGNVVSFCLTTLLSTLIMAFLNIM